MKNIVHLTRAQWNTLITTGSITVEGVTHTYDADNEYFVREDIATEITSSSTNEDPAGAKAVYDFVSAQVGDIESLLAAI